MSAHVFGDGPRNRATRSSALGPAHECYGELVGATESLLVRWQATQYVAIIVLVVEPIEAQVVLIAQKGDLADVRESIKRVARICEVQVDKVDESPGRLGAALTVDVTGEPEAVALFRKSLRGSGPSSGIFDAFFDDVADDTLRAIGRGLRKLARRR